MRLCLLILALPLLAQNALYLDLSGTWRLAGSDDPRFAQPDLDDSQWRTLALPIAGSEANNQPIPGVSRIYWLRRRVELPAGTDATHLALTLGTIRDGYTGGGFVTCCCARFDASGTVTIANAGHPSPYCDGREVAVEAGLPLGVIAAVTYEESVVRGERFTFVSDGVVEAENARRELFGFDRTREISTKSAHEIAEAAKAWGQTDDITVVTVRRNA